ncbi:hypothetical protein CF327_g7675 [Tilletia walkeri]|nr:hypothetical protein CF327_g7675 [Tilletia walkeri]
MDAESRERFGPALSTADRAASKARQAELISSANFGSFSLPKEPGQALTMSDVATFKSFSCLRSQIWMQASRYRAASLLSAFRGNLKPLDDHDFSSSESVLANAGEAELLGTKGGIRPTMQVPCLCLCTLTWFLANGWKEMKKGYQQAVRVQPQP